MSESSVRVRANIILDELAKEVDWYIQIMREAHAENGEKFDDDLDMREILEMWLEGLDVRLGKMESLLDQRSGGRWGGPLPPEEDFS